METKYNNTPTNKGSNHKLKHALPIKKQNKIKKTCRKLHQRANRNIVGVEICIFENHNRVWLGNYKGRGNMTNGSG